MSTTRSEHNFGVRKPTDRQGIHCLSKMGSANTAQMVARVVTLGNFQRKHMIYFEYNQPHYLVWPVLALGLDDEFWIGIGWLNLEIGWRNGDGGWGDEARRRIHD